MNRNNFGTIYFSLLSDSFLQIFPVYQNFTKRLFHVHFVDNVDNFVYKSKIAVLGLSCMWITLSCLSLSLALLCELREMVCESCTTSLLSTVSSEKKKSDSFFLNIHAPLCGASPRPSPWPLSGAPPHMKADCSCNRPGIRIPGCRPAYSYRLARPMSMWLCV